MDVVASVALTARANNGVIASGSAKLEVFSNKAERNPGMSKMNSGSQSKSFSILDSGELVGLNVSSTF